MIEELFYSDEEYVKIITASARIIKAGEQALTQINSDIRMIIFYAPIPS
jgi:hypothetical protein